GDAHEILRHNSSCAEIEVSDFAVAHLACGQTDTKPGSYEQRARAPSPERIPGWSVGECDCVAVSFGAIAPSIEYDERDWPRARRACHYISNVIRPGRESAEADNGNFQTQTGDRPGS